MAKHSIPLVMAMVAVLLAATATTRAASLVPAADDRNSRSMPTAYEMLGRYGFPPGILPEGVQGYELRPDGSFEVHLPRHCKIRIAGQNIHYSSRIAGKIQNGLIKGLEGVKVKIFILFISVRDVRRNGNELRLHAGIIAKSFSANDFSFSPRCN
ncbi:hypothetical protein CFC21_044229 [Triticum aestivum]|uniref:Uncharacterized protein n=3 Tax=Triticum TaxID=4564 RepID=A0A9R1FQL0_WHEAT|nr:uncharacterized protein LOC119282329 [Triticum dicoccoides]XP_044345558.1 uncharacterized protein LOC123066568 [Triticum aestivum]KAF7033103.1 hypothetical protein CFC21_044229 [Triticum aestivum]CDM86352.1 unnamed protein product [Triticum aestivum]VAH85067.1 unnamed protein product [Triticum turgidum subsp. durum]